MGNPPHPEAALIGRARRARRLTVEEAATAAGISHQRWRQIEGSKGNRAPAETIAHMAHAVGITAERLERIAPGDQRLTDATEILEEIELQATAGTDAFESRVREAIDRLSADDRSIAEDLLQEFVETQRQNRAFLDKLLIFVGRGHSGRSGKGKAKDSGGDQGPESAAR